MGGCFSLVFGNLYSSAFFLFAVLILMKTSYFVEYPLSFVSSFLMIGMRLCILGKNNTETLLCLPKGFIISIFLGLDFSFFREVNLYR